MTSADTERALALRFRVERFAAAQRRAEIRSPRRACGPRRRTEARDRHLVAGGAAGPLRARRDRVHWIGGIATDTVETSPLASGALNDTVEVDPRAGRIANQPSA
jgi:hypothetical protein